VTPALDIIVAPKSALEELKANPTWLVAFIVTAVLMITGYFLQKPATEHATVASFQHQIATGTGFFGAMTDEQKARTLKGIMNPPPWQAAVGVALIVISILIGSLFNTLFLLLANAIGKGTGTFKHFYAASITVGVASFGLGSLVLGIICLLRGPDAFNSSLDIYRALPGLAWLVPGTTGTLGGFLAGISIFALWGFALNVLTVQIVAGVRGAISWIVPIVVLVLSAGFLALASSFSG
jgi:hypothetical protein